MGSFGVKYIANSPVWKPWQSFSPRKGDSEINPKLFYLTQMNVSSVYETFSFIHDYCSLNWNFAIVTHPSVMNSLHIRKYKPIWELNVTCEACDMIFHLLCLNWAKLLFNLSVHKILKASLLKWLYKPSTKLVDDY